eukprot:Selendium_serpulae@DN4451_c0_g1_i3.p2
MVGISEFYSNFEGAYGLTVAFGKNVEKIDAVSRVSVDFCERKVAIVAKVVPTPKSFASSAEQQSGGPANGPPECLLQLEATSYDHADILAREGVLKRLNDAEDVYVTSKSTHGNDSEGQNVCGGLSLEYVVVDYGRDEFLTT